eukprot:657449-Prorocentrum_minimum.AAC.1
MGAGEQRPVSSLWTGLPRLGLTRLRLVPRPARGVLGLHVEDTALEPEAPERAHAQVAQVALLLLRQQGGRVVARLVEPGLQRGPVVRHHGVHRLAVGEHNVHVHLGAVQ